MLRRWLPYAEAALILAGAGAYLAMPHEITSDGLIRLETTRYLARGEIISAPTGLLQSALALPLYHFGDVVATFNMCVFFAGLVAIAFLLWNHVPAPLLRRLILILLAASMFGNHTQQFFGEVLTSMLVATGLVLVALERPFSGFALVILGVLNTQAALPALFLVLLDYARPPYRVWKAIWPTALCAALVMFEFYLRRGTPLESGYETHRGYRTLMPYSGLGGFSYPIVFGVLSILFSFGKGLALFVPGLWLLFRRPVLAVPEVLQRLQRHSIWFVVGLVLVYAKWWSWHGGWFWGPRFFLFACIPAAVALAIHLCDERAKPAAKALTLVILAWSAWVWIDGTIYGQLGMEFCTHDENRLEPFCIYTPEFSALFRPFLVPRPLKPIEQALFAYSVTVACVLAAPLVADLVGVARHQLLARRSRPAVESHATSAAPIAVETSTPPR